MPLPVQASADVVLVKVAEARAAIGSLTFSKVVGEVHHLWCKLLEQLPVSIVVDKYATLHDALIVSDWAAMPSEGRAPPLLQLPSE